ncbi:MAG: hypothetical protein V3W41_17390 [Planctomycetota bacterium]
MARRSQHRHDKKSSLITPRNIIILGVVMIGAFVALRMLSPSQDEAARSAFVSADYEDAADIYGRIVSQDANDNEARYYFAVSQRHLKDLPQAVQNLTVLRAAPEWRERAFYQLALTLMESEHTDTRTEIERASEDLRKTALYHEAAGLFYLKEGIRHREKVAELIETTAGPRARRRHRLGLTQTVYAGSRNYRVNLERLTNYLQQSQGFDAVEQFESLAERAHLDFLRAAKSFRSATRISDADPKQFSVLRSRFELATIEEFRDNDGEAEKLRREILSANDKSLHGDLDLEREAEQLRERTLEFLAENLIKGGRHQDAVDVILASEADPDGDRPYAFERLLALAYDSMGQNEQTLRIVNKWLEKNETLADMNFLRGKYHYDREEYTDAQIYLEKGLSKTRSNREHTARLADVYMKLQMFSRANNELKRLVDWNPNNWQHQLLRVKAMEGMGWIQEARAALAELLHDRFNQPGTTQNRVMRRYMQEMLARYKLLPTDLHQAGRLYGEDNGNFLAGTRYLGFLIKARNIADAEYIVSDLKNRIPLNAPERYDLTISCGELALMRQNWPEAAHCFDEAARQRPHEAEVFVGATRAALGEGRLGRAWSGLENVRAISPDHPELPELRFRVYSGLGDDRNTVLWASKLLKTSQLDFAGVVAASQASTRIEDKGAQRAFLSYARKVANKGAAEQLVLARLYAESNDQRQADRIRMAVVKANPDDLENSLLIAEGLFESGKFQGSIEVLEPAIAANPLASADHMALVADSWDRLGNQKHFIESLTRLMNVDRRQAWDRASALCERAGADAEVKSILSAARREDLMNPELLRRAARVAIRADDRNAARRAEADLRIHLAATAVDHALIRARLLSADNDIAGAERILVLAMEDSDPAEQAELLALQVDIFGNHQQSKLMLQKLTKGAKDGIDIEPAMSAAVRHAVLNALPEASALIVDAIKRFGEKPDLLFHRGLQRARSHNWKKAKADLKASYEAEASRDHAIALAIVSGVLHQRNQLARLAADADGDPPLPPRYLRLAEFIDALINGSASSAIDHSEQLLFETGGEQRTFAAFVSDALDDDLSARIVRAELPIFFLFRFLSTGQRQSLASLDKLNRDLQREERAITLLRARTLMSKRSTYDIGVGLVAKMLESSSLSDEAALEIYLGSYVAARNNEAIQQLVDVILLNPGFSTDARRETAEMLIQGGHGKQAARLLNADVSQTPQRLLLEARAQFAAGNINRAATIIRKAPVEVKSSSAGLMILAEDALRSRRRKGTAYGLAQKAVNASVTDNPLLMLTLAKAAFAVGRNAEAWQTIGRYIDADITSGDRLARAIAIINEIGVQDAERRDRIFLRQQLLDPSRDN